MVRRLAAKLACQPQLPQQARVVQALNFRTIGHRGVMGVEPENTVRSFVRAEREGLDEIELDLHLSRDGKLVVMHDAMVDRTTDGAGQIGDFTVDELRKLDAGSGEQVPLFEEVLDLVTTPIQAEIKDRAAARALAATLRHRDLLDRVTVSSFHDEALREISECLPGTRTALIASRYGADLPDRARSVGASTACLKLRRLTLELAERCHDGQVSVIAWVVNTQDHLRLAKALGVDGATTDFPEIKRVADRPA